MNETLAIVVGLVVVVLIAFAWSFFRRPAVGMRKVRAFRVEIHGDSHGERQNISIRIPGFFVGKAVQMASGAWERQWRRAQSMDFEGTTVTPRQLLDAADRSRTGQTVTIDVGHGHLDVRQDGTAIQITAREGDDRHGRAEITVPRALVESLAQEEPLSPRELLARIDAMGPGDLVSVKSDDGEVRITAEAR